MLASSPVTPKSSSKELNGFIAIFGGIPIFSRKNSSSSAETSGGGIIYNSKVFASFFRCDANEKCFVIDGPSAIDICIDLLFRIIAYELLVFVHLFGALLALRASPGGALHHID
ncbi:hypothetical protein QF001_003693 [Paraburkholderia youngii]|uniref:hypothetical protein n=1 Tax=Paraburkholderia youngii TaxID=2782701 RepID=UPI003D1BAE12